LKCTCAYHSEDDNLGPFLDWFGLVFNPTGRDFESSFYFNLHPSDKKNPAKMILH
jgi:hypothetical protein